MTPNLTIENAIKSKVSTSTRSLWLAMAILAAFLFFLLFKLFSKNDSLSEQLKALSVRLSQLENEATNHKNRFPN